MGYRTSRQLIVTLSPLRVLPLCLTTPARRRNPHRRPVVLPHSLLRRQRDRSSHSPRRGCLDSVHCELDPKCGTSVHRAGTHREDGNLRGPACGCTLHAGPRPVGRMETRTAVQTADHRVPAKRAHHRTVFSHPAMVLARAVAPWRRPTNRTPKVLPEWRRWSTKRSPPCGARSRLGR